MLKDQVAYDAVWVARLLEFIRRKPDELVSIGEVASWFRCGYCLDRVEELLEQLVLMRILRRATAKELRGCGRGFGYFLVEGALGRITPDGHLIEV